MVTLIFYAVVILGGIGAVWGVVHVHDGKVKTAALAPWEPLTKECTDTKLQPAQCADQWRAAIAANVSLQSDFNKLDAERQNCTNNTIQLGKDTQAAIDAKDLKLVVANKKILDLKASEDALEASLDQPAVVGEACAATLAKIDAHNDAIGARRLRDYGATGANQGGQPAAAANPGNDTVRISH